MSKRKSAYSNIYTTPTDTENPVPSGTQETENTKTEKPKKEKTEKLTKDRVSSETQETENTKTEKPRKEETHKLTNSQTHKPTFRRTSYSVEVNTARAVKMLAVELDRDIQELVGEALTDLLQKYRK